MATILQQMQAAPRNPPLTLTSNHSASSTFIASVAATGTVAPKGPDASESGDAPAQGAYTERSLESRM
ncbi:uncharacterized protein N7473_012008 [Penicillium subrubescens]|uniref:uncharacterized protein n=1 Tax=Penicillium subrubescens TaxID=1316194 RepID=UPI002545B85A|nr:uncharacterized protein N7473_012008 [Penicillium subrubescens]KAJ5880955.1 hypothetical protein N7473_012008 [Penicillium subrubescens]